MSLPDHYLEEPPDPEWCEEHRCGKPCRLCRLDYAEQRAEAQREER